jgi:tripartite-type tricarboxylate transporter receptor subunit TctC
VAPAGTPRPVIDCVRGALVETLTDPEVRKRLAGVGADPASSTPEEQEEFTKSEIAKWIRWRAMPGSNLNKGMARMTYFG